jgi:short-chain fatty acids transporter
MTRTGWIDAVARTMERWVPDAITTAVFMMVGLFVLSLGVGGTPEGTLDGFYRGLWMLLPFTMQMTLILVLSIILAASPVFRKIIVALSRLPRNRAQVMIMAVLCASVVAYLNWGLSLALAPLIAIHFCKEAERKGIPIDFMWMMAVLGGAGSIWQFGCSGSAPLVEATADHPSKVIGGEIPLSTTIWSPAALAFVVAFVIVTMLMGWLLMPRNVRPVSHFVEASAAGEEGPSDGPAEAVGASPAQRLERSAWVMPVLAVLLAAWLGYHFIVKQASLDINSVNTIVLLLGVVLHRTVGRFTQALKDAVARSWSIVVMYHLYAGVAGLIQFTPVGEKLAHMFDPVLSRFPYLYVVLTVVISTVVAIFVPTSGGQWMIQGRVTVGMAETVGASAQRGMLALSVGDHMGNLITPFWAVVGASIVRIDFRQFFGYRLIFAAVWFVMGTAAFTFLPC